MSLRQRLYFFGLLVYLAVLPVANTIALRSLMAVMLMCILLGTLLFKQWRILLDWQLLKAPVFIPLLLWVLYLFIFPLWAEQPLTAWENLRGQWGVSILAWSLGIGGVLVLGRKGPSLCALGMASAFLVGLHLILTLLAWSGLLGSFVEDAMSIEQMISVFLSVVTGDVIWTWQNFPWGFRGFDPMHGNLGYTANQAIALFICTLLFSELNSRHALPGLAIFFCLMGIVIAFSRGALIYGLGVIILAILMFSLLVKDSKFGVSLSATTEHRPRQFFLMAVVISAVVITVSFSLAKDERWHQMRDKVRIAFMIDDPVRFLCEGPDEVTLKNIRERMADREPSYTETLIEGLKGDGARISLMRAGWVLVKAHPLGLDGSRLSYKKLINTQCGHAPALVYEHAHQGWMDTAMALGWTGTLLLMAVFFSFAIYGWRSIRHPTAGPWALALFLLAIFWALRGFADSIYREHYLQMQAVLLGYLCARVAFECHLTGHLKKVAPGSFVLREKDQQNGGCAALKVNAASP